MANLRARRNQGNFRLLEMYLRMMVQIIPKVILTLPSTISSAPMDTSFTPLLAMKSRALFTFAILWNLRVSR